MSFQSTVAKLEYPLKDLVLAVTDNGTQGTGKSERDIVEVNQWIEKVARGDFVKDTSLKDLDTQLIPRTYIVGNYLTAADIALYGTLHPLLSKLQPHQYYSQPALTRYFDHIQSRPSVRIEADTLAPAFSFVSFDLDNVPKAERKLDAPKKKEKPPKSTANTTASVTEKVSVVLPAAEDPTEKQGLKKDKKDKKNDGNAEEIGKKKAGNKPPAAPEDSGEPVPSMIDLRVGLIVEVKKHPDADGLYVEQIDIGEDTGPRTVVSGLVHYIPIEDMQDKYIVAVCNLKPANMRGIKSFAMVLAATHKDGKSEGIELIQPPANSKPGDRVYFEGAEFENATALTQLNPKKKIFETIQPGLITLDTREAAWINPITKIVHKIRTKEGICFAPTLVDASLS